MARGAPDRPESHTTPVRHHAADVWEVTKVALREMAIIAIIGLSSVVLNLFLRWIGKVTEDGRASDEAFGWFVWLVKIAAYVAFGVIMSLSLLTDMQKAFRRFLEQWRRRHWADN